VTREANTLKRAMDSVPMIIAGHLIGGVASGASKQFTESVIQQGKQWIASRFQDHQVKAVEKANRNANDFVERLALKIHRLEEAREVDSALINRALEEPNFGALLQSALIGSAQTESQEKHELLATLISCRLTAANESLLTATSQIATNAISHCSLKHLQFLGFCASFCIKWSGFLNLEIGDETGLIDGCRNWFETRFAPYKTLTFSQIDLLHLESVSCAGINQFTPSVNAAMADAWTTEKWQLRESHLRNYEVGECIIRLWNSFGKMTRLTSVGFLIGWMVSDQLCGADSTKFTKEWTGA